MTKIPDFSQVQETKLIRNFVQTQESGPITRYYMLIGLRRICHQYRDLSLGSSLLNEAHSTRWLIPWKDQYFARGRSSTTLSHALNRARQWTRFLFSRKVLDDDAFFYLDILAFLRGESEPPHLEVNLQRSIYNYTETMKDYQPETIKIYRAFLHNFNLFQNNWEGREVGFARLHNEKLILAWLQDEGCKVDEKNLGVRIHIIRDFLEFLRSIGHIMVNAADTLYNRHPRCGWRGLARAAKSDEPLSVLENLKPKRHFEGPWGIRMREFILLKRSLGALYDFEERTLDHLDRYLSKIGVPTEGDIAPCCINKWIESHEGANARTLATKRKVAEQFFNHAISLGFIHDNPAQTRHRESRRPMRPFIFSREQIQEILTRANTCYDIPFFLHRGATYRLAFIIFYCLGLRVGEVCRLSLGDIDFEQGLILIRRSKFYKSRILPMGPKLRDQLAKFVRLRIASPYGNEVDSPLFSALHGKRISRSTLGSVFRRISREMCLEPEHGQRGPCLHSFRHSFAIHRLLRWYREGEDVQAKLPLLSAFMGHIDICSTQVYLQETTMLMDEANIRFEAQFGYDFVGKGGHFCE